MPHNDCSTSLPIVAQRRKHSNVERLKTDLIYKCIFCILIILHATKSPFSVIHWSLSIRYVFPMNRCRVVEWCAPAMECTKQNPNLFTFEVTTIITNYNRSNHISSSQLIFFIICLLIHLWSIVFPFRSLASQSIRIISEKEGERDRNKNQTNTQLGFAWMSFVFFRSYLGLAFLSVSSYFNHLIFDVQLMDRFCGFYHPKSVCICNGFFIGRELYKPPPLKCRIIRCVIIATVYYSIIKEWIEKRKKT